MDHVRRKLVFSTMAGFVAFPALLPRARGDDAATDFAVALTKVSGHGRMWQQCAWLALSIQLGVSEKQFRAGWPGLQLDSLPPLVLSALLQGSRALPLWLACLDDERPTGVKEVDILGVEDPAGALMNCRDLALTVTSMLLPQSAVGELPKEVAQFLKTVKEKALAWEQQLHSLTPENRLAAWCDQSFVDEWRTLLRLTTKLKYEPAYPRLEGSFLKRAPKADDLLGLEVLTYLRHRRAEAKAFWARFKETLQPANTQERRVFDDVIRMGDRLVLYASTEAAVADWRRGRLQLKDLDLVVQYSVDQPWATHSLSFDFVSTQRPTAEANVITLIKAAHQEQDLKRRLEVLSLAEEAVSTLKSVSLRTVPEQRVERPQLDAAQWKVLIEPMRSLLTDRRYSTGFRWSRSPACQTANLAWRLLGPDAIYGDAKDRDELDWLFPLLSGDVGKLQVVLRKMALDLLDHPKGISCLTTPELDGAKVAEKLTTGSAKDWRKQLNELPWDRQLAIHHHARTDAKFAKRQWTRLVEFVDLEFGDPSAPSESFSILWTQQLEGRRLNETHWEAMKKWLVAEARAHRCWDIMGTSVPSHPGLSLVVIQTPLKKDSAPPSFNLVAQIHSDTKVRCKAEKYQFSAVGPDKLMVVDDDRGGVLPMEAIALQHRLTENDEGHAHEFLIQLTTHPAK